MSIESHQLSGILELHKELLVVDAGGLALGSNYLPERLCQFEPPLAPGAAEARGQNSHIYLPRQRVGGRLLQSFTVQSVGENSRLNVRDQN